MFNGANMPHRPTFISTAILLLVVIVIYHFLFHREK